MHLDVDVGPSIVRNPLVSTVCMLEKGQLRERIPMTKPLSHEPVVEGHPEADMIMLGYGILHLIAEGVADDLIRIEKQNPSVSMS